MQLCTIGRSWVISSRVGRYWLNGDMLSKRPFSSLAVVRPLPAVRIIVRDRGFRQKVGALYHPLVVGDQRPGWEVLVGGKCSLEGTIRHPLVVRDQRPALGGTGWTEVSFRTDHSIL